MKWVAANVGTSNPLPADGVIQVAFDRYLDPLTASRQSFLIRDAFGQFIAPPVVAYDPVSLTVTLSSPNPVGTPWLIEGQPYTLELGIYDSEAGAGGVRSINGSPLDPNQTRLIGFTVGPKGAAPFAEPKANFCADVLPIFLNKCSAASCHGGSPNAAASLVLTTSTGVSRTAISRAAQGANTGPRSGLGSPATHLFGVDMPIVDPGNPGNSWLMYKVLLARLPTLDGGAPAAFQCSGSAGEVVPAPSASYTPLVSSPVSETALLELSDNVLGREMPYPAFAPKFSSQLPLTLDERQRIRLWIAQGADVPECGTCNPVTP